MYPILKYSLVSAAIVCCARLAAQEVVLPEAADPAVKTAGSELQEYCGKMLGGQKSAVRFILKTDPALAEEAWRIRSVSDGVELSGGSGRGVLYAAYHYLEDCCGVRFLTGDAEFVPELKELPVKELDLQGKPAFRVRSLSTIFAKSRGRDAARRRINSQGWTTIAPEYGGAARTGSPAPCHTFAYYVPVHRYFKTHPEYFALTNEGKRVGGQFEGQLCLSNPDVRRIMLEQLRKYIASDREKAQKSNQPYPKIYDVTQNDNQKYCVCPNCKALAAKYGNKQSGIMLDLVNELADGIRDDYPDVSVSTFAYQYTEAEPENIKARPNVVVRLCDTRGNQVLPIQHPSNRFFQEKLARWQKLARLTVWDYGDNFGPPHNLPAPSEFTYQDDYRFLPQYADIIFCEISSTIYPDAREYKYYLLSRFMENPNLDFRKESQEFANLYYGPAGSLFLQYRQLLRDSADAKKSFVPMYPTSAGMFAYLDVDTLKKSLALFEQGRELLKDDPVRLERWNIAGLALDRAILERQLHLTQAFRRAGGQAGTLPFDYRNVLQRARKVHLDYMDKYVVRQAVSPYFLKRAPKLVAEIKKEYARLEGLLDLHEKACRIPDQFKDYPPERVYLFFPPQMSCRNKSVIEQDDPEALIGRRIRLYHSEKTPAKPYAFPLKGEFFRYDVWRGFYGGVIKSAQLTEPGWHWIKLARLTNLSASSVLVFPGWNHLIGVADAYSDREPNDFDCWVHLKTEGPAYRKNAAEKVNSLFLDAVVLIRADRTK